MKKNVVLVGMVMSLLMAFASFVSAQSKNTEQLSAVETLSQILGNKDKVPLELYPPGYINNLLSGNVTTSKATTKSSLSLNTMQTEGGGQQMMQSSSQPERKYHVVDLGTLGGAWSRAYEINEKGQVVGISTTSNNFTRAFIWSNGYMQDLGALNGAPTLALDINNNGVVVGRTQNGTPRAFVWSITNGMQDMGTLGGNRSVATAINDQGHIVGYSTRSDGTMHAFLRSNGIMQDLGTLGGNESAAYAINNHGQIVGYGTRSDGTTHAFLRSNGIMQDLGTLGGNRSVATAINDLGHIVGQSNQYSNSPNFVFLWINGVMNNLGIPKDFDYVQPAAINNYGEIVGMCGNELSQNVFPYSNGTTENLNFRLYDANSGWTLSVASGISNTGQIVGWGINPQGQERAFLLNPVDPNWIPTITNTPAEVTYGPPIVREPGKSNLVFVTHGAIPRWQTPEESTAWVKDMTNLYTQYFTANNMTDWQVVGYMWQEKAKWGELGPQTSLNNAFAEGTMLGDCVTTQNWSHIHFITHSAGSGMIQAITAKVKSNVSSSTTIHSTFLDPFLSAIPVLGELIYGYDSDWADHYFSRDILTGGSKYQFTQGVLDNAYSVDVTFLDPNKIEIKAYFAPVFTEPCIRTVTAHDWPITFYMNSLFPNTYPDYDGFGFSLSKEGGNWNSATNQYTSGSLTNLGTPDLPCLQLLHIDPLVHVNLPLHFLQNFIIESVTGILEKSDKGFVASSGSPAWLAIFVTPTNDINFVSFDAQFLSAIGSQGLLTVYWDTNVIGSIDERVARSEMRHYSFPIPRTQGSLTHMLGFRVNPFTATQSKIMVTNVVTGLYGPIQPFSLTPTTDTNNGFKVWKFTGEPGFEYGLEASTNLIDWQTVATLLSTNGSVQFVDQSSTNMTRQFYRAVVH